MLHYRPRSAFSRTFILEGDGEEATLHTKLLTKQGSITIGRDVYEIQKHGITSGFWTMDLDGVVVCSAQKKNHLTRTLEFRCPMGFLLLRAKMPIARTFRLKKESAIFAKIKPYGPLGRRANIDELIPEYHFPSIAFALWLCSLSWKGYH